jgi:hypothetical protein
MSENENEPTATHHLMRVRVRTRVFNRLREIAEIETDKSGEHTSVSDLVRSALSDYISVYDSTSKLDQLQITGSVKP